MTVPGERFEQEGEPYEFELNVDTKKPELPVELQLAFFGNYNEPINQLSFNLLLSVTHPSVVFQMDYQPRVGGKWNNRVLKSA